MTPGWNDAAVVLLTPLLLGAVTLRAIGLAPRADRLAWVAWAYLVGSMVHAAVLLCWFLLGKPGPGTWLMPIELAAGLAAMLASRRWPAVPAGPERAERFTLFAQLATIAALAAAVLLLTTGAPATMLLSDGVNVWGAKAKVFHLSPGPGAFFREEFASYPLQPDYPLLNPLLQFGTFERVGGLTLAFQRLPVVAFYPALLLAAIACFRRHIPWLVAVVMAVMLISGDGVRLLASDPYSDVMVMLGLLVTVDAWSRWHQSREPAYWRLMVLAATFTVFSKNEGSMLVVVIAMSIALARLCRAVDCAAPRRPLDLIWLLMPVFVALGQHRFNAVIGAKCDLFTAQGSASFSSRLVDQFGDRLPRLVEYLARDVMLGAQDTRLVFALLAGMVLLCWRRVWCTAALVPVLVTLGGFAAYILVLSGSYWDLEEHLVAAGIRISMHLAPLALLAAAMLLGDSSRQAVEPVPADANLEALSVTKVG